MIRFFIRPILFALCLHVPLAGAQELELTEEDALALKEFSRQLSQFAWQDSGVGDLSTAEIDIPSGYTFLEGGQANQLMQMFGNLSAPGTLGVIGPADLKTPMNSWFVVFEFDDIGYVKDDEKDDLDPDAMMKEMKKGQEYANEIRRERGLDTLHTVGWEVPPAYNENTQNLEWALRLRSGDGSENVNHQTKVLGRNGVMNVIMVCGPDDLRASLPSARALLKGFRFKPGHTYAEFKKGDRVAEYGLAALVVGGGLAAAAKSGLLGKMIKPLIIGVVAVFGFIAKFFGFKKDN